MALDRPQSARSPSIWAISLEIGTPSCAAASLSASQNGASSEMEVRWPPIVKERLAGRPEMVGDRPAPLESPGGGSTERILVPDRSIGRRPLPSVAPLGLGVVAPGALEPARLQRPLGGGLGALGLGDPEARALLVGPALALRLQLLFAVAVKVDNVSHHASGPI